MMITVHYINSYGEHYFYPTDDKEWLSYWVRIYPICWIEV